MKAETVDAALWAVFTIGGITASALTHGPMQENAAKLETGVCHSPEIQECVGQQSATLTAYKWERGICIGGVVLALPGLVRFCRGSVEEIHESQRSEKRLD